MSHYDNYTLEIPRDDVRRARHGKPWEQEEVEDLCYKFRRMVGQFFLSGAPVCLIKLANEMQRPIAGIMPKLVSHGLVHESANGNFQFSLREVLSGFNPPEHQPKETTMTKAVTTPTIATRTFIQGVDAANMTDDDIFKKIREIEQQIADLDAINAKPKKLVARIEALQEDVKKLVEYVDSRE